MAQAMERRKRLNMDLFMLAPVSPILELRFSSGATHSLPVHSMPVKTQSWSCKHTA